MNKIVDAFAEFLQVFGFTFLVPGFVFLGAVICSIAVLEPSLGLGAVPDLMAKGMEEGSLAGVTALLLSYCFGHLSFAVGRPLSRKITRFNLGVEMLRAVRGFRRMCVGGLTPEAAALVAEVYRLAGIGENDRAMGTSSPPVPPKTSSSHRRGFLDRMFTTLTGRFDLAGDEEFGAEQLGRCGRIYTLMWAQLRLRADASFRLIQYYWVINGVLDGLGAAMVSWIVFLGVNLGSQVAGGQGSVELYLSTGLGVMALLLAMVFFFREGGRYARYQVEEMLASFLTPATLSISPAPPLPGPVSDSEGVE